jgi:hypothetical protein
MERITPSKTNNSPTQSCRKTDRTNCRDKTETNKTTGAENKDTIASNIFRKYYEALLQGFSGDFINHQPTGLHCT